MRAKHARGIIMSTKKKIFTFILVLEALVIAGLIAFLFYLNSDTVKLNRQWKLAQNYLLEEDYEQAIAAYEIVIQIDPKNTEAYLGLAEAYAENGDLEKAVKVLEQGYKKTKSEELQEEKELYVLELAQDSLYLGEMTEQTEKVEKSEMTEQAEETEKSVQTEMQDITNVLKAYAETFAMCNLEGVQYEYDFIEDTGYSYYMTYGLKGVIGCLDWIIVDIDADNTEELLAFILQEKDEGGNQIAVEVYEAANGGVELVDSMVLLDYVLGSNEDVGRFRVMLKDRHYICADNAETAFVCADGTLYEIRICSYDGEKLVREVEDSAVGSDLYGYGKEPENAGFIQKLNELGLYQTADDFYENDEISINMADTGMELLFEVQIDNSFDYQMGTKPVATCHLIKGIELD